MMGLPSGPTQRPVNSFFRSVKCFFTPSKPFERSNLIFCHGGSLSLGLPGRLYSLWIRVLPGTRMEGGSCCCWMETSGRRERRRVIFGRDISLQRKHKINEKMLLSHFNHTKTFLKLLVNNKPHFSAFFFKSKIFKTVDFQRYRFTGF